MIVYSMLFVTLLTAFASLRTVWRASARYLGDSWPALLLGLATGWFIYLYGTWVYLSVYLKYVFAALVFLTLFIGMTRNKQDHRKPGAGKKAANISGASLLILLCILYYTGINGKPRTVALQFPLKTGKYFILQGGKGLPANLFHYSYRGAIYAIDIARLDERGNRAKKIFSNRLEDYHIFNDTVYSPCAGRIVNVRNDNPDNIPPHRERGPSNLNAVLIETDSFYVFMGHFRKGSVIVSEGQTVRAGQALAQVGNSGMSLEPHLHIQAHTKKPGQSWYSGAPLYIEFDGKTYLLFQTIRPKNVSMIGGK
ncbi:M23 family metallopeptidase [Polluticoccus soli]|uniref:M23 family metallopeptidase n=1 Tax=Polluticoccus soli TaxID=3034150 RepID=UPI0023E20BF3|nr:peptidoglycan DD-metalloendopeptidase family protein [Flavipsychrobacter sp. JY13-12]